MPEVSWKRKFRYIGECIWKRLLFNFFHSQKKIQESYTCMQQIFTAYLCLPQIFVAYCMPQSNVYASVVWGIYKKKTQMTEAYWVYRKYLWHTWVWLVCLLLRMEEMKKIISFEWFYLWLAELRISPCTVLIVQPCDLAAEGLFEGVIRCIVWLTSAADDGMLYWKIAWPEPHTNLAAIMSFYSGTLIVFRRDKTSRKICSWLSPKSLSTEKWGR